MEFERLECLTVKKVAELLKVDPRSVYNYIRRGQLLALSTARGGSLRVPVESLKRFQKECMEEYQERHGIISEDES